MRNLTDASPVPQNSIHQAVGPIKVTFCEDGAHTREVIQARFHKAGQMLIHSLADASIKPLSCLSKRYEYFAPHPSGFAPPLTPSIIDAAPS